jgi:hypothetical protein
MTDLVPLGYNEPAPASRDEVIEMLEAALAQVREGGPSLGFLEWAVAQREPCGACQATGVLLGGTCHVCEGVGGVWWPPEMEGADFTLQARFGDAARTMTVFTKAREQL